MHPTTFLPFLALFKNAFAEYFNIGISTHYIDLDTKVSVLFPGYIANNVDPSAQYAVWMLLDDGENGAIVKYAEAGLSRKCRTLDAPRTPVTISFWSAFSNQKKAKHLDSYTDTISIYADTNCTLMTHMQATGMWSTTDGRPHPEIAMPVQSFMIG